jgi:hypothetical protein
VSLMSAGLLITVAATMPAAAGMAPAAPVTAGAAPVASVAVQPSVAAAPPELPEASSGGWMMLGLFVIALFLQRRRDPGR